MVFFFIDESGEGLHAKGFAALCAVVVTDPEEVGLQIAALKDNILHDLRYEGILGRFPKEGFHYTSDHREIKNAFISFLRTLTFQAYICFDPNVTKDSAKNLVYDRLLGKLLKDRLRDYKTEEITICFEQHDKPERRLAEIKDLVNAKLKEIDGSDRKSFSGTVKIRYGAKKGDLCLSVADYICGVFKGYVENKNESETPQKRDFEDLRLKIRCIHNIANDEFYDRRNPFP